MPKPHVPTGQDLKRELQTGQHFTFVNLTELEKAFDLDGIMAAAVQDWQDRANRYPITKDAIDVTMYLDPSGPERPRGGYTTYGGGGRLVEFESGMVGVTSIGVGYSTTNPAVVLVQGQDYFLEEKGAPLKNRPYEWIRFCSPQRGISGSIQVIGKRGYRPDGQIDDDIFRAMLSGGLASMGGELQMKITGGLISWKEADGTAEQYGVNPLEAFISLHTSKFERNITKHMLVRVGR